MIGLAVSIAMQSHSAGLSGTDGDRSGIVRACEPGLRIEPVDVLASGDQQLNRVLDADFNLRDGSRNGPGHDSVQLSLRGGALFVQVVHSPGQGAQSHLRRLNRVIQPCGVGWRSGVFGPLA